MPTPEIGFRPLTRDDYPHLAQWLSAEHVRTWWDDERTDNEHLEAKYGPRIDDGWPHVEIVSVDGRPCGFVQWCPIEAYANWPDHDLAGTFGIDYLIGEESHVGRGIGTRIIEMAVREVFDRFPEAAGVVADPYRDNLASCRALEKAGFSCVFEGRLGGETKGDTRLYRLDRIGKEAGP